MRATISARTTYVWVGLSAITVVSWGLASARDGSHLVANTPITIGVLAIGAVKVRLIIREFMEVRQAPAWLRRFTNVWIVVLWITVLAIYFA
jgi:hypothetical protein